MYTGKDRRALCATWHLAHTFAPVGRPTGSAVAERFSRTPKEHLIWLRDWESTDELEAAVVAWLHHYNSGRHL